MVSTGLNDGYSEKGLSLRIIACLSSKKSGVSPTLKSGVWLQLVHVEISNNGSVKAIKAALESHKAG